MCSACGGLPVCAAEGRDGELVAVPWTLSARLTVRSLQTRACSCWLPLQDFNRHALPTIAPPQLAPSPKLLDEWCRTCTNRAGPIWGAPCRRAPPAAPPTPRGSSAGPGEGPGPANACISSCHWLACWRTRLTQGGCSKTFFAHCTAACSSNWHL